MELVSEAKVVVNVINADMTMQVSSSRGLRVSVAFPGFPSEPTPCMEEQGPLSALAS